MKSRKLLKQLTLEEKIKWTTGNSLWTVIGSKRLEVDELVFADGPHGVRVYKDKPGNQFFDQNLLAPSTMFPSAAAMACTFNESLLFKVGETIGKECNHYGVDVLLAPGMNLKKSPLAGRNFEYYSEDPYLTERCAVNFIKGVQSTGVSACAKHFALNEQENQRRFIDTICDERTMHEYYLRPFHNVLKEAKPDTMMSAYNRINGDYASESSYLLKDVLRNQWGYEGCIMSDWNAVQNKVKSIKNGLNLEMPGPSEHLDDVYKAVENKYLTEAEIDASLEPLMDLRDKILENPNKGLKTDLDLNHEQAYLVSKEAIVLLENDGILPLDKNIKIGVIGTFAKEPRINGGGSATLLPYKKESPLEELEKVFTVEYTDGYNEEQTTDELLDAVGDVVSRNEIILYFTGTTEKLETEGKEREHMNLPEGHIEVFNEIKKYGKKVIVILSNGSALNLTPLESNTNAIIEGWFLGSSNGRALTEVIAGDINPSGRLSETVPYCIEHTPHFGLFPSKEDSVNYSGDIVNNGYRYYDTHKYPVRYPFGYGLSYTTFEYSDLKVDKKELSLTDTVTVSVTVKNTGQVQGKEVVQLYIKDQDSYLARPNKELKRFAKVDLEPNQEETVTFELSKEDFSVYNPTQKAFVLEAGLFDLLICKDANTVLMTETVAFIEGDLKVDLSIDHTLNKFKEYQPDLYQALTKETRALAWHESEEPAKRVLKRLLKENMLTKERYEYYLEKLKSFS